MLENHVKLQFSFSSKRSQVCRILSTRLIPSALRYFRNSPANSFTCFFCSNSSSIDFMNFNIACIIHDRSRYISVYFANENDSQSLANVFVTESFVLLEIMKSIWIPRRILAFSATGIHSSFLLGDFGKHYLLWSSCLSLSIDCILFCSLRTHLWWKLPNHLWKFYRGLLSWYKGMFCHLHLMVWL